MVPCFFEQLSTGSLLGSLPGINGPGGHLDERTADGVSLVANQTDATVVEERHQGHGAPMEHNLTVGSCTVGELNALKGQIDLETAINHASLNG
jgi:hypothetical protein